MKHQPLVSVIIIFWNAEAYLAEAIESVFAQYYRAWELLLVDDGSTDGSTSIALNYTERHRDRVQYLEHEGHENRGMSVSRNIGIRHAQGKYISFLDADDVWLPQILEQQVRILDSQPRAGMVYGPIQYWYSWTGKPGDHDYIEELGVPANQLINPPILLPLFLEDRAAVPSGIMVRREVIESVGGFEEAFRGEYEDQAFCAKVCLQVAVFASDECLYRYRQHPNSNVSVGQRTGQTDSARLFFLKWLGSYLDERKIADEKVWRAVQRELLRYRHPTVYLWLRRWQQTTKTVSRRITSASVMRSGGYGDL